MLQPRPRIILMMEPKVLQELRKKHNGRHDRSPIHHARDMMDAALMRLFHMPSLSVEVRQRRRGARALCFGEILWWIACRMVRDRPTGFGASVYWLERR